MPKPSHTSEDADNTAANQTTATTTMSDLQKEELIRQGARTGQPSQPMPHHPGPAEHEQAMPKTHGPDKAHQLAVRPYEVPASGDPLTVTADPDDCICILRAMCQALGAAERTHYRGLAISALEEAQHWLHDVLEYEVKGMPK
jgi:hypothetical protein